MRLVSTTLIKRHIQYQLKNGPQMTREIDEAIFETDGKKLMAESLTQMIEDESLGMFSLK